MRLTTALALTSLLLLLTATSQRLEHESPTADQMAAAELASTLEQNSINAAHSETWAATKSREFSNPETLHTLPKILAIAYTHLVQEDIEKIALLTSKKDSKVRLSKSEIGSLNNALVTRLYIESQFGGKDVVSSEEAVEMMSDVR